MLDAFKSYSIPYQLTTTEALSRMKQLLKPNGIIMANVIGSAQGEKGQFLQWEYQTLKQHFPVVDLYLVSQPTAGSEIQNLMLIGAFNEANQSVNHKWQQPIQGGKVLTDDFAPVDQLMLPTML
jgi:spermidine synthase